MKYCSLNDVFRKFTPVLTYIAVVQQRPPKLSETSISYPRRGHKAAGSAVLIKFLTCHHVRFTLYMEEPHVFIRVLFTYPGELGGLVNVLNDS